MPTILREGAFRFFFYSNENGEPVHVHVQRDDAIAKFWLRPVALADNVGFSASELGKMLRQVRGHEARFVEAWNEFFDR